jgi:hypothetical protein
MSVSVLFNEAQGTDEARLPAFIFFADDAQAAFILAQERPKYARRLEGVIATGKSNPDYPML